MKIIQITTLIITLLLTASSVNAGFVEHKSKNFQIIHTSIQDCDEEITITTHNAPKKECYECESKIRVQEPQQIKPTTSVRQVIVEEEVEVKSTQKKIETLYVNVKFTDTICDEDCKKDYERPQVSNPHRVEKKSIVSRIINFVYDCITW
ncbi:MAG: hypothetical protein ACMXYB_03240 [Candidatus Woesearchaeota archaeon]